MPHPHRLIVALLTVTAVVLTACSADDAETKTAGKGAVAVGGTFQFHSPGGETVVTYPEADRKPIADITGPSVVDPQTQVKLADYKDKIVVLNAWGQWCGPCRTEVDDLEEVQDHLKQSGGTIIGINVKDNQSLAKDFMEDNGLTYPSIYDPPFKLAASLGGIPASVVPTTIVLDKQHRPAVVFLKQITASELLDAIKPLETT